MRTFIAVRIVATPQLRDVLSELAAMKPALRTIAEEQLHVTLKFLGETAESQISDLQQVMARVAQQIQACSLTLKALGAFPNVERPTVVWVGFDDTQPLIRLANELAERCQELGFEPEHRPFRPHLTLARIKSAPPRRLTEFLRGNAKRTCGSSIVTELELFRSDLKPDGPIYTSIGTAPLLPNPAEPIQ